MLKSRDSQKASTSSMQFDQEAPALPATPFRFVLFFLQHYWAGLLVMVFLEAGQAACQILIPYAVKELIDTGSHLPLDGFAAAVAGLKTPLWMFVGLSLGILFFSRASGALLVMVGPHLRRRVRSTVFHFMQFHSQRYYIGHFAGSLSNRLSELAMGVNHSLWTILFDFWPVLITFSVSTYLMLKAESGLALFLVTWVSLYIAVSFWLARRCQAYAKRYAATRSLVSGKIVDGVTNMMNTKLFAQLDFERKYVGGYLDKEVTDARKTFWFMEGMRWFQFVSTMFLQIAIILLALKYWQEGRITVGSFAMVTSLALLIINDARGLSRRFLEFFEYLGNIADGVAAIVQPHEVLDHPQASPLVVRQGGVEFENVNFSYSSGVPIFQNLNVKIQPGERVGLVGFSGSGKTTFVNLILRLYDLQSGCIQIDGQSISECTQDSLRGQISMIPQEPMLFHRTLMENIRYGRNGAADAEVIEAAKKARAHDFIESIPEKYEALVGERGVKLSGGQRQRIAIARAILKNAPILILDEATSSLDSVTEKYIQTSLEDLMKNRTVIVVAHRLSTISHLDRILVFDQGKIIEDGSHAELLKQKGHYHLLWSMQSGGFLPEEPEAVTALPH